jgi:hypothetical protein
MFNLDQSINQSIIFNRSFLSSPCWQDSGDGNGTVNIARTATATQPGLHPSLYGGGELSPFFAFPEPEKK